jgi:hypothetical protein
MTDWLLLYILVLCLGMALAILFILLMTPARDR